MLHHRSWFPFFRFYFQTTRVSTHKQITKPILIIISFLFDDPSIFLIYLQRLQLHHQAWPVAVLLSTILLYAPRWRTVSRSYSNSQHITAKLPVAWTRQIKKPL